MATDAPCIPQRRLVLKLVLHPNHCGTVSTAMACKILAYAAGDALGSGHTQAQNLRAGRKLRSDRCGLKPYLLLKSQDSDLTGRLNMALRVNTGPKGSCTQPGRVRCRAAD
jgi:hypothetical protein